MYFNCYGVLDRAFGNTGKGNTDVAFAEVLRVPPIQDCAQFQGIGLRGDIPPGQDAGAVFAHFCNENAKILGCEENCPS